VSSKDYEYFEVGQKAARVGLDSEEDIINRINAKGEFCNRLKKCLVDLGFSPKDEIVAYKPEVAGLKTDIFIKIDGEIGVSVKSSSETSFHQTDRRTLEHWKLFLNMPEDVFKTIKEAILRVSRNPRDKFILEKDRDKIKNLFSKNLRSIIREIFQRKEENLKLLMVNDKRKRRVYVFNMDEAIDFLCKNASNNVRFTDKGIVLLGDFISVQRKGGNGKHVKIPKTDWKHPGNQLQFKTSPITFAEHAETTKALKFGVIDY
jgi:hypothetical protein